MGVLPVMAQAMATEGLPVMAQAQVMAVLLHTVHRNRVPMKQNSCACKSASDNSNVA